jgi:hypothetical protein
MLCKSIFAILQLPGVLPWVSPKIGTFDRFFNFQKERRFFAKPVPSKAPSKVVFGFTVKARVYGSKMADFRKKNL